MPVNRRYYQDKHDCFFHNFSQCIISKGAYVTSDESGNQYMNDFYATDQHRKSKCATRIF